MGHVALGGKKVCPTFGARHGKSVNRAVEQFYFVLNIHCSYRYISGAYCTLYDKDN